jgi:mono/diheme cytochrome c family protein
MEGLAPALVNSEWVLGSPEILPRILLHGLAGPIKVGGQSWNLEMPPLGAALTDEQIAGVLTYIRRDWDHNGSPVSVQLVSQIRKDNLERTKAWTAEDLKAFSLPEKKAIKQTASVRP